ncbi:antitoxin VbhA family protein, partial [Burkholderia multivorans]
GKPDVAFIGQHKAIFIHGCFWHGHNCPRGNRQPATNVDYWRRKIERNRQRDSQHLIELGRLGWSVLTIWECELRDVAALSAKLVNFMVPEVSGMPPGNRHAEVDPDDGRGKPANEVADRLDLKYRLEAVENAIATQRLEGLEPDPRTIAELEQVAAGKLDLADVIANLRRRIAASEFKSPLADD